MKEKVYLFGAYLSVRQDGQKGWGNFIFEFTSMPSYEDLKQEIKKRNNGFDDLVIINLKFLTKEQYYALKGEKPDEQQSELGE